MSICYLGSPSTSPVSTPGLAAGVSWSARSCRGAGPGAREWSLRLVPTHAVGTVSRGVWRRPLPRGRFGWPSGRFLRGRGFLRIRGIARSPPYRAAARAHGCVRSPRRCARMRVRDGQGTLRLTIFDISFPAHEDDPLHTLSGGKAQVVARWPPWGKSSRPVTAFCPRLLPEERWPSEAVLVPGLRTPPRRRS